MRRVTACSLFLIGSFVPQVLSAMPVTIPVCTKRDGSFEIFLRRFEDNVSFRRSRLQLPLVVRAGDGITAEATIDLWGLRKIQVQKQPLIYSQAERARRGLVEHILLLQPKRYAEVFQSNGGDADDTKLLFRFRNVGACWTLEGFDDLGQ